MEKETAMIVKGATAFTGRHMLITMIAFFGVVVGVNLLMARFAVGTFGGTVVANSYVASQHFNDWLAEGRRQAALGWQVSAARGADSHLKVTALDRATLPLTGLTIAAEARHPLGREKPITLALQADGDHYRSTQPLPAGRWIVALRLTREAERFQHEGELR